MLDPSGPPARDISTRTLAALVLSALAGQAHAGFFIPRDITMFMFTASPDAQMAEVAHGFRADLSVAAALTAGLCLPGVQAMALRGLGVERPAGG